MKHTIRTRIIRIATVTLALGLCLAALAPAQRRGHGLSLPSNYGDTPQEARFRKALQWFMRGVVAESEGRYREARQYYERALAFDPESIKIRKSLVLTFIRLEDYERARAEALKIDPHDSESAILLSELYRQAQMADSVMMFLELAIKLDSSDIESRRRMIAHLENFGLDDSAMVYRSEIARLTGDYSAFAALGVAHFRRGQYEKAAAAFRQSIELNSTTENITSFAGLADCFHALRDLESQRAALGRLLEVDSSYVPTHRRFIQYYSRLRHFDSALVHSKEEVRLAPQDQNAIRTLGVIAYNADSLALAKEQFDLLISLGDLDVANYLFLGQIFLEQDNLRYALINFRKSATLSDSLADGWLGVAQVYRAMDSLDAVERVYSEAVQRVTAGPDRIRVLFAQGAFYEAQQDYPRAEHAFEAILEIDSAHAPSLNYLGYMLIERNQRVSYGKTLVARALEMSPDNGAYIDSYGWALYQEGDFPAALDSLRRAADLIPGDPTIMDHLGDTFDKLNQSDSARIYWRKALEIDSTNAQIREKLSR